MSSIFTQPRIDFKPQQNISMMLYFKVMEKPKNHFFLILRRVHQKNDEDLHKLSHENIIRNYNQTVYSEDLI